MEDDVLLADVEERVELSGVLVEEVVDVIGLETEADVRDELVLEGPVTLYMLSE